jgi:hypothetical protein
VNVNAERTNEREMTVSKGEDGSATTTPARARPTSAARGVKVSSGVVGGGFGIGKTVTTKTGYKFCVKPDMKNARELQDQIARLANAPQAEVDAFAKAHPRRGRAPRHKDDSKETTANRERGRRRPRLRRRPRRREDRDPRRQGQRHRHRERGHNEGGLKVKAGKYQVGTDIKEEAKPRDDAAGDKVMDVSRDQTSTDAVKFLDSLPVVGSKKKDKDKGALATATGPRTRKRRRRPRSPASRCRKTTSRPSSAGEERAKWNNACISWGRDIDDWSAAAAKVAKAGNDPNKVKEALAEFVGGNSMRKEVVLRAVRPNAESMSASQWEFPESLKTIKQSYMDNAVAASEKRGRRGGQEGSGQGRAMAKDLIDELERLDRQVRSATDFKETSTQAEMKSTIASRITKVQIERRKLQGVDQATAEKEQEEPEFRRLFDNCQRYQQTEAELYAQVEAQFKKKLSNADPIVIAGLTGELKKLYARWTPEYEKMATFAQKNNRQKDKLLQVPPRHQASAARHPDRQGRRGDRPDPDRSTEPSRRRRCVRPRR